MGGGLEQQPPATPDDLAGDLGSAGGKGYVEQRLYTLRRHFPTM